MKKSFRVATAFTGIAAAAAFTPLAAAAATPGTATQGAKPEITEENCNSGTSQWIHLYYTPAEDHGPVCFAHPGNYYLGGLTVFVSLCAGNNFGFFSGYTTSGTYVDQPFRPGNHIAIELYDVTVHQSRGVADSYTCLL